MANKVAKEEAESQVKQTEQNAQRKAEALKRAAVKEAEVKCIAKTEQDISSEFDSQATEQAEVERQAAQQAEKENQIRAEENEIIHNSMNVKTINATALASQKQEQAAESKQRLVTLKERLQKAKLTENEAEATKLQSLTEAATELSFKTQLVAQAAQEKQQEVANAMSTESGNKEQKKLQLTGCNKVVLLCV